MPEEESERGVLILVAEDNRADEMLMRRALKQHQVEHTMLAMDDGDKVIDYVMRGDADDTVRCPDLLLLDLNLPKRNGEEVLTRVRQSARFRHIPVLIVTSSDSPKDRAMAERLGAANYFQKPPDLDRFMKIGALVKEILAATSCDRGQSATFHRVSAALD
ncbi:MAG: response regulator [Bryobacteraceae bacterium]